MARNDLEQAIPNSRVGYAVTAGFLGDAMEEIGRLRTLIALQPSDTFYYPPREEFEAAIATYFGSPSHILGAPCQTRKDGV